MLIGLGYQKRQGKSTVAKFCRGLGFVELSFAEPIKKAVMQIYGINNTYTKVSKEIIVPHVGKSFRMLCEEFGFMLRNFYGDEFVIALLERKLEKALNKGKDVVISDVKYPKEVALVEKYEGHLVRVHKPTVKLDSTFISEVQLVDYKWPHTIINNEGLKELQQKTVSLITQLKTKEMEA
jgi:hypothetical protein